MKKNKKVQQEKGDSGLLSYGLVAVLAIVGLIGLYVGHSHTLSKLQQPETAVNSNQLQTVDQISLPLTSDKATYEVKKKIIKNLGVSEDNTVVILGPIGEEAISIAQDITRKAAKHKKVIVLINSPGGSIMDGVLIISAIQAAHSEVDTVCLQICASMAAMIFEYGTKRYMVDRSTLMFHEAAGGLEGQFNQVESRFKYFNGIFNKMNYEVATRAGKSPEEFKSKLPNELWLDSEDALSEHYSDGIVNLTVNSYVDNNLSNISQTKNFLNKFRVFLK